MNRRTVVSQLNLALLLLVAATLASISVVAQQAGTLTGTLTDPQGAAVANNVVELRWNDVGPAEYRPKRRPKKHITTITDSAGKFSVSLFPGDYDIFVYRDGFAPICTVVLVENAESKSIDLRFPALAPQRIINQSK
jgi:Carboxypeptidase regulatory-like domain